MKKLAIYLDDESYTNRLVNYLTPRLEHDFSVASYTESDTFRKSVEDNSSQTLIIGDKALEKFEDLSVKTDEIFCLTERKDLQKREGITFIYKYDPASSIIDLLVRDTKRAEAVTYGTGKHVRLMGIYSPVKGIGNTSLSLAIAESLSEDHHVLYINLEAESCLMEALFLDDKHGLSELMYHFATGKEIKKAELGKFIQRAEDFDVIAPIMGIKELQSIDEDTWLKFIEFLEENEDHDVCVIEFSEAVGGLVDILPKLDRIIIPYREGRIRGLKTEQFREELVNEMGESVHEKLARYLKIPVFEDQDDEYEQIGMTKVGKWVKNNINELW